MLRTLVPSLIAAAVAAEVAFLARHRWQWNRWGANALGIVIGGAAALLTALFTEP
jgi:hypothetical protein